MAMEERAYAMTRMNFASNSSPLHITNGQNTKVRLSASPARRLRGIGATTSHGVYTSLLLTSRIAVARVTQLLSPMFELNPQS